MQWIANSQEELQNSSTSVERREVLGRDVQAYESTIQACQQDMRRYNSELEVQRTALQGESCPRAIGHEYH